MLKQKLEEIKNRLSLSDKELALLLDLKTNIIENLLEKNLIVSKIIEIFDLTEKDLETSSSLPLLKISKPLDLKKYKNKINAYNEIIKGHYKKDWNIYVLSKIKLKKRISLLSLFKKQKRENNNYEFTPSFLAVNGKIKMLINFKENTLNIIELNNNINEDLFVVENIRYRKRNKVKIN